MTGQAMRFEQADIEAARGVLGMAAALVNVTVYAGPAGVFVLRGEDRDAPDGGALTLTAVSTAEVRALPLDLVAPRTARTARTGRRSRGIGCPARSAGS